MTVKECSLGRKRPMVGGSGGGAVGEERQYIWEAGVPKNMEECSLYKLSGLVLLENSHMGLGGSVEKLNVHLFLASLIAAAFIFAVIHLCFLYQPA